MAQYYKNVIDIVAVPEHSQSYFQVVIVAVIKILDVHVQEADLDVAVSIYSYSPVVVSVIGVCPGIQWGCYLTRFPRHINTIHCGAVTQKKETFLILFLLVTQNISQCKQLAELTPTFFDAQHTLPTMR